MTDVLSDEVLRLPDPPPPTRRSPIPLVASVVPVLAALGLWLATGTQTMLWFAALGPLIAIASLADAARAARRHRRLAARDAARMRRRVTAAIAERHTAERARLWVRTPDVLAVLGGDEVWRPAAGRGEHLVVGRGRRRSAVRVEGGREDAASTAVRQAAALVDDAPVTVPVGDGVAVVGPAALAGAVVRALVLQVCHVLSPERVRVAIESGDDDELDWLRALPHTHADAPFTLALAPEEPGDAAIVRLPPGAAVPPRCAAVLTLTGIDRARLTYDGATIDVRIEGIAHAQAVQLAAALRDRAGATYRDAGAAVELADIIDRSGPAGPGLEVTVGTARGGPFRIDLVSDGPHAVIAGMTGSGKSELLTTWITALCTRYGTEQVTFLLADFKGGTAFDALARLPHVTGVITDLDAGGAARALESLRAELRRREAEIVRTGTRDVVGTALPRLIIVVDEFAALTAAHPELVDLFTDIAARGRALGMHLILGTQRAAGTFRDALLANCPLRISMRVADPADSRALIGGGEAASLSGAPDQRGIALVRRASDVTARAVRVALSSAQLVTDAAHRATGPAPRRPWLPALPRRIPLDGLHAPADATGMVLGVADEPERQRQPTAMLDGRGLSVIGRAGSGRTTTLAVIAAQRPDAVWIGADPEAAWDAVAGDESEHRTLLVDDLDALLSRFPADYEREFVERLERIVHAAGTAGQCVALSVQRGTGAVGRIIDLLPHRAILATATRADFAAAGGSAHDWRDELPPGRGILDGRLVQFALPSVLPVSAEAPPRTWRPGPAATAVIAAAGAPQRRIGDAAARAGVRALSVDEPAGATDSTPVVVVGDGEQWQRAWRRLQAIRADGGLVVDAASAADYRVLTGDRGMLPYCLPGRDRAWRIDENGAVERVVIGG